MKICIFSHPRSGSTLFQEFCARKYNLKNYDELFDNDYYDESNYNILEHDNYIVKIMAFDFLKYDFEKIKWENFDKLYFIERKNLFEACASFYVAHHITTFDKLPEKRNFTIDNIFLINWIKFQEMYYTYKSAIIKKGIKHHQLFYETINEDEEIKNNEIYKKSIQEYQLQCENYDEIDKKIKNYFKINY